MELQADLIALCTHGQGGLRDIFIGSIAQQVMRQVSVPVLFIQPNSVKESEVKPISQILLPLDGLKSHEAALPIGAYLATKFHAKLRLLTVIPTPKTLLGKEVVTSRYLPHAKTLSLDISAQEAEDYLYQIAKDLSSQGLIVSDTVLRGDAVSNLIKTIESEGIGMVIVATHGLSAFDAQWEGSLTPGLFSKTPVPVILVHVAKNDQE
jgi:nucleotide-binding universal stress UspA family protein